MTPQATADDCLTRASSGVADPTPAAGATEAVQRRHIAADSQQIGLSEPAPATVDCGAHGALRAAREGGAQEADGSQRSATPPAECRAPAAASPHASPRRSSSARKTWQQSTLPGASPGLTYSFSTYVVGRRFQQPPAQCADGDVVTIAHEVDNPRDRCVLSVLAV